MGGDSDGLVERGNAALLACDWTAAQQLFEDALTAVETPEALDGLGQALYWQHRYPDALQLRQRAYVAYRERGDRRRAAFVAVQLAQLHGLIHGNAAAVNGWIGHAARMLEDCGDCAEQGWLELFRGCIAADPSEREQRSATAIDVGRRLGSPALEFDALGYLGKARIEQGDVATGMALIDEAVAAASSGLVADPWAAGEIYCSLFHACEITVDVKRAQSWLGAVDGYVERTGELPISAICRMHYGGLLTAAGRWQDAERELQEALRIYDDTYVGTRSEPLLRLAELRARQGRLEECERLLDGYGDHPAAALPLARLLHRRGQHEQAEALLERGLPDPDRPLPLVPALALLVEVKIALGRPDDAASITQELGRIATATGLASFRGFAHRAAAQVAVAGDPAAGRDLLEQAMSCFSESGLDYDLAVTRLALATLLADEAPAVARAEARAAMEGFHRAGSPRDADAAASLLRRLGEKARTWEPSAGPLTPRQTEVLALLADGLSNAQIAERLFISPRTAEHHVSNILAALNLNSRAEAAAYAVRQQSPQHPQPM